MEDKTLVVIPARYGSTRLPAKALKLIGGKPMITRVYERAKLMKTPSRVIVATDDERILKTVTGSGGEAVMTSIHHASGTDRVAEVARKFPEYGIVVNLQGDEPFVDTDSVDRAVNALKGNPGASVSTLCVSVERKEAEDLNVTCVVRDLHGMALYFSKLPIPHHRDGADENSRWLKHLGVYVFRRDFLLRFSAMSPTPLEKLEKLEQLRILEHGEKILLVDTDRDSLGIDSPADLERAEAFVRNGEF
ncbi:MAG: 3-deoxy-manno-octulosonate cytidylyltransferase [Nitrospinae bacterium]|nr:3-deoxy-manno-octulosonate cytidylyltransferase [Nitrospinota bacterium]